MTESSKQHVWFITGSSTALGRDLAGQELDPWESLRLGAGFPEGE